MPDPASLLVHRHDERLNQMHNARVRGELRAAGDGRLLVPAKVVEPMGSGRPSDAIRLLRHPRLPAALPWTRVEWTAFKALASSAEDLSS